MDEDEIESQLVFVQHFFRSVSLITTITPNFRTLVVAGHETTSTTASWLLYEISVHPEHQSIIREELRQYKDYDLMPFMNAAIKVSTTHDDSN